MPLIKASGSSITQYDDIVLYRQCARVLIYKSLESYDSTKQTKYSCYLHLWLKGLSRSYTRHNTLLRSGGMVIKPVELDEREHVYESVYDDIDIQHDLDAILTHKEREYIKLRSEGYNYTDIKRMLSVSAEDFKSLKESADEKVRAYIS